MRIYVAKENDKITEGGITIVYRTYAGLTQVA